MKPGTLIQAGRCFIGVIEYFNVHRQTAIEFSNFNKIVYSQQFIPHLIMYSDIFVSTEQE